MNWLNRIIQTAQLNILQQVALGQMDANQAIQALEQTAATDLQSLCSAIGSLYNSASPAGVSGLNILETQFCLQQDAISPPEPQPMESELV